MRRLGALALFVGATSGLCPRLQDVQRLVRPGARVADIGCDHGQLAIALAETCERVIGVDVARAPLAAAARNAAAARARVELREGDGFEPLGPSEVARGNSKGVNLALPGALASAGAIQQPLFSANWSNILTFSLFPSPGGVLQLSPPMASA